MSSKGFFVVGCLVLVTCGVLWSVQRNEKSDAESAIQSKKLVSKEYGSQASMISMQRKRNVEDRQQESVGKRSMIDSDLGAKERKGKELLRLASRDRIAQGLELALESNREDAMLERDNHRNIEADEWVAHENEQSEQDAQVRVELTDAKTHNNIRRSVDPTIDMIDECLSFLEKVGDKGEINLRLKVEVSEEHDVTIIDVEVPSSEDGDLPSAPKKDMPQGVKDCFIENIYSTDLNLGKAIPGKYIIGYPFSYSNKKGKDENEQ